MTTLNLRAVVPHIWAILENVGAFLWMLLIVVGLPYFVFRGFFLGLQSVGLVESWQGAFWAWWAIGAACAAYWPWRYRKQLDGQWLRVLPGSAVLSFTGPFALLFGYPI